MQLKSDKSVFVTMRVLEKLKEPRIIDDNYYNNFASREVAEASFIILNRSAVQGEACISYAAFAEFVQTKNDNLLKALNSRSREEPLLITIGDERIFSTDGVTRANRDEFLATYVIELKVPHHVQIVPAGKTPEHRFCLYKNAYALPKGMEFKKEQIVGFWREANKNEYVATIFSEPYARAIEANEMAIWKETDAWWYQCGPNGQPLILNIENANIVDRDKATVLYNLNSHKDRAKRYNGASCLNDRKVGEVAWYVQAEMLAIAVSDKELPEDLSINYQFPKIVQCTKEQNFDEEYSALTTLFSELDHSCFKVQSKAEFLQWYGKYAQALALSLISDEYKFKKIGEQLHALKAKFLAVTGRFCKVRDTLETLWTLAGNLGLTTGLSWLNVDHLSDDDNHIANIFIQHQYAIKPLFEVDAKKCSDDKKLEAFDAIIQLRAIFSTPAPYGEVIEKLELFLSERWERIKTTELAYTKRAADDELTLLCLKLAKLVFQYKNQEKNLYQYLMPTIKECYDAVTDLSLSDLKLNQFVLDEHQEYGFNMETLYNHHSYANGDPQAMAGALMNPYIPSTEEVPGVPISEETYLSMIYHSMESERYHTAYEKWMEAAAQDAHAIRPGQALRALAEGLYRGSVVGTGSEFDAGPEALEAINVFHAFLQSLGEEDRTAIFNLRLNDYNNQTFGSIWDILTQKDTRSLSCVKILSGKISTIIAAPIYQEVLFGADVESKHKAFEKAAKEFLDAHNNNAVLLQQAICPIPAEHVFKLIIKHQEQMTSENLIHLLQSLNVPSSCQYPTRPLVRHLLSVVAAQAKVDLVEEIERFNRATTSVTEISLFRPQSKTKSEPVVEDSICSIQ